MDIRGLIDLHMHTSVSDGTDSPAVILEKVKEKGLTLFSVTDHDAVKACSDIIGMLDSSCPAFITGAEFSCRDDQGKYHILGYGYDPEKPGIGDVVSLGHGYRMKKVRARLEFLKEEFGFEFPAEEIRELLERDNPGKPHIGQMMIRHGYAKSIQEAISDYIDKKKFPTDHVRPEEAIRGILASGGIPVLAHPAYGSGDEMILGDEMEERLKRLMDFGIAGLEAYYSGFPEKLQNQMLALAEKYGLYVTAGSDYHGEIKLVELGDNGLDDIADGPAGLRHFLEDVEIIGGGK